MSSVQQQPTITPDAQDFLDNWIDAVNNIGENYFSGKGIAPSLITHWRQLTPKVRELHKVVAEKPTHTAAFIACVVGLYNTEEGERMQRKVGCIGLGKLIAAMNQEQRNTISALIMFKQEW